MQFFSNTQNHTEANRKLFTVILDSKEVHEISYYPISKKLMSRKVGSANRFFALPAIYHKTQIPGFLKKLVLELNQPKIIQDVAISKEDAILKAKTTVAGYEVQVGPFNTVARAYLGKVKDPINQNRWLTCTWDRFGRCRNANRTDCNLKLN